MQHEQADIDLVDDLETLWETKWKSAVSTYIFPLRPTPTPSHMQPHSLHPLPTKYLTSSHPAPQETSIQLTTHPALPKPRALPRRRPPRHRPTHHISPPTRHNLHPLPSLHASLPHRSRRHRRQPDDKRSHPLAPPQRLRSAPRSAVPSLLCRRLFRGSSSMPAEAKRLRPPQTAARPRRAHVGH